MAIIKNKANNKRGFTYEVNISYKEDGNYKRYRKRGFPTKAKAEEHERTIKDEIKKNGSPIKVANISLNQLFIDWLQIADNYYSETTIKHTIRFYEYCKEELGKKNVRSINYKMLEVYFNKLNNKSLASNQQRRKALNRLFVYAIRCGYIESNPIQYLKVGGIENHREEDKVLSDNDFFRIINYLDSSDKFCYHSYSIAIKISRFIGLRISEVLALTKSDFNFIDNTIIINKKLVYQDLTNEEIHISYHMKTSASRSVIPLPEALKSIVSNWFHENPFEIVCCTEDGSLINPKQMNTHMRRVTNKLNIHFHFHMLRHTYCTDLVTNGVDIATAQQLMRHANANTTLSTYTHIQHEQKKAILDNVFEKYCTKFVPNQEDHVSTIN